MKAFVAILALLGLAGCAQLDSLTGKSGGQGASSPPPAPVATAPATAPAPAEPHLSFIGADPIKRRSADDLGDRTMEVVTLRNNAVIYYTRLKEGTFPGTYSDAEALRVDMGAPYYKDREIVFQSAKVKTKGPITYEIASTSVDHCFVFHHNFGVGKRGDQQLRGAVCYPVTAKDAPTLEREMLETLERARIDGEPIPTRIAAK